MLHYTQPGVLYKCFLPFNIFKLIFILEVIQVYSKKIKQRRINNETTTRLLTWKTLFYIYEGGFNIHSIWYIVKHKPLTNYLIIFLYPIRGFLSDAYLYSSILRVAEIFLHTSRQTTILAVIAERFLELLVHEIVSV